MEGVIALLFPSLVLLAFLYAVLTFAELVIDLVRTFIGGLGISE